MITQKLQAIILAAGKSSRFNTSNTKLSYTLCGQEMIVYPVKLFQGLAIPTVLVVGYQKELVKEVLARHSLTNLCFIEQEKQEGTGHALLCTKRTWQAEHILVMNGDMPLVTAEIIEKIVEKHLESQAAITFATAHYNEPQHTYGRVVRTGNAIAIVEAQDYKGDSQIDCCINAGIYLFKRSFLEKCLAELERNTKAQEFFLPDLIATASKNNELVETVSVDFDHVRGINTLKELWAVEHIKRSELITHWLHNGVRFTSPQSVHIDIDVTIGPDTIIGAGVQLRKKSSIGSNCIIDAFSVVTHSTLCDNVTIYSHCVLDNVLIAKNAFIGPFAHIRNESSIGEGSAIGNFVEVSNTAIGNYSKAKHLSYLGHAQIGSQVNIGAGTITCNYNGFSKNTTTIDNGAFIGSNTALVAPLSIGKEAIVGAGSVITQSVPDDALAIARSKQVTKDLYAPKLKVKYKASIKTAETL